MIDIWHNILWSKYKGRVFSRLHEVMQENLCPARFFQIAETDTDRASLSKVDLQYHEYPFELVFQGAYSAIPKRRLVAKLFAGVWSSDARLIILPGFHLPEFWAMLFAAVLRGKKRAVFCDSTIHDQPQTAIKSALKRIFFSLCDGYFCYGARSREYLIHHGAEPSRIFFRCQAAALPPSYSVERALQERLARAASPHAPRLLYVGRLAPEKSLDVLIKAFAIARRTIADATLVLIGAGPQRAELEELVQALNLVGAVEFGGGMEPKALAMEYARATCTVLPSISEPWGLVANESLSYGTPIIVSDRCGCVPELVVERVTGFVFNAGSVVELAEKLSVAPVAFADIGSTAQECLKLISEFNPDRAASQILAACQQMLRSR